MTEFRISVRCANRVLPFVKVENRNFIEITKSDRNENICLVCEAVWGSLGTWEIEIPWELQNETVMERTQSLNVEYV